MSQSVVPGEHGRSSAPDNSRDTWLEQLNAGVSGPIGLADLAAVALRILHPGGPAHLHDGFQALAALDAGLRQPPGRWLIELRRLTGELKERNDVGPLVAFLLCLLDPKVAATAQASGLLRKLLGELKQTLPAGLAAPGVRLLQRRAPLLALSAGLLDPAVSLDSTEEQGSATMIALASHRDVSDGRVGRWAAVYGEGVYTGSGSGSGQAEDVASPVAIGWSDKRRLHVLSGVSGVRGLWRPGAGSTQSDSEWPSLVTGAVSATALTGITEQHQLLWGVTDGGGAVDLGCPVQPTSVTCAGDWTAAIGSGQLLVHRANGSWLSTDVQVDTQQVMTANDTHLVLGGTGLLRRLRWSEPTQVEQVRLPFDGKVQHLSSGGDLSVAASSIAITVLAGGTVVADWKAAAEVTAVALSPDGACLAIATSDRKLRFWRMDAPAELQLTSYTTDVADGADLLGISPTVDALAALICARAVAPPLSVGLFGAWGSGKSFFMRVLERRVQKVTEETRESGRPQHALWAWRNTRQVRFNAWHYAAADVWAGLLEQLLRELSAPRAGRLELPEELEALQRRRLQQLAGAQQAHAQATEAVDDAHKKLEEAEQEADDARHELERLQEAGESPQQVAAEAMDPLTDARTATAGALEPLGLAPAAQSFTELWRELAFARSQASSLVGYLQEPSRRRGLVLALAVGPVTAVAVGILVYLVRPSLAGVASVIAGFTAVTATLSFWLRAANGWVGARLQAVKDAEVRLREAERQQHEAVEAADKAQREAARNVAAKEQEVDRLVRVVAEAEHAVAASGPGDLLREYLAGRTQSDDYRGRLGLIGIVRSDLEVLSSAVEQHNAKLVDPKDSGENDDVVNRVVLYVDDLDRCPPGVVVRVLEAVHLLLSFPLFVVVVGVDASWVARSLQTVYPQLLSGGEVNPDHYLEKIFQLPIWLDQPTPEYAREMLMALLADSDATDIGRQAADLERDPAEETTSSVASSDAPSVEHAGGTPSGRTPPDEPGRHIDLATSPPRTLSLTGDERSGIASLAPLLTRSPRALKRYLNTYRLLKAVVSDSKELERARFLLAVATGRPDVGERLLMQAGAASRGESLGTVAKRLPPDDFAWLDTTIPATLKPAWRAYKCDDLAPTAAKVHRFVFRTADAESPDEQLNTPEPPGLAAGSQEAPQQGAGSRVRRSPQA